MGRIASAFVVGAIAIGAAAPARAADAYRLSWSRAEGAEACIDEPEIVARVRERLGRDPFTEAADRAIEGHVTPVPSGFRSELVVRARDGFPLGRRTIETAGDDCVALGQAVTLAIVLTIDPNARLERDESTASFPIDDAPVPSAAAPPPAPVAVARSPVAVPCPACPRRPASIGLSLGIVGAFGLLPRPALGAEIEATYPALRSGPVVGVRWLPTVQTDDGHIGLGITSGKLGYCASLVRSELAASLCGAFEAGVTTVLARDLVPVSPGEYPYVALAAGLRLFWPVGSELRLETAVLAVVPLIRQRFRVDTAGDPAFRSSAFGAFGVLGVGFGG